MRVCPLHESKTGSSCRHTAERWRVTHDRTRSVVWAYFIAVSSNETTFDVCRESLKYCAKNRIISVLISICFSCLKIKKNSTQEQAHWYPDKKTKTKHTHHEHFWDAFKEVHELVEAVVAEFALPAEVVVVSRDELIEGHPAVGLVAQKIHHLFSKLLCALYLLHGALCMEAQAIFN